MYKLSICIPTYNRVDLLKHSLPLVISACRNKNVEIIVSDNASTDGTKDFMNAIIHENPTIRYYCNKKNLGFDGNFINCYRRACGEYVLLLSDDDFIIENQLDNLLYALDSKPVIVQCGHKLGNRYKYTRNNMYVYDDKNLFMEDTGIWITFISGLVIKNEYIKEINNIFQYSGSNILQSYVAMEAIKHSGIYIILEDQLVNPTSNDKVNYDVYQTWIKTYGDLIINMGKKCGLKENILWRILARDYDNDILNFVLKFRLTCRNEENWSKRDIWIYLNHFPKIAKKYKVAINCPKYLLPIYKMTIVFSKKMEKICGNKLRKK
jgi:glycosyltransferase involved in cell wall biosynthesis